ncbi:hypothetical protein OHA72_40605 [Dactylosporangium sp. NBC_01737]|nr:hypothetical protein OHA72_40605 [Dactylosporangium sp. NBC_01737]
MTAPDAARRRAWPGCPPDAGLMQHGFASRWARFHTLPDAKRYATTDAEHAEILHRHRTLLTELVGETGRGGGPLTVVTCPWSATARPTPRDTTVAATTPGAVYWRSDDLATEHGFRF